MKNHLRIVLAALAALPSATAMACSGCGCSLSSDWDSQGLASGPGLRFDLRYDYLNQDQVRSGTGKVAGWPLDGHEQELYTRNRYLTAALDYSASPVWGISLQVPMIDRVHATNGMNFDGSDSGTSHTRALGDIKLLGRYTGLSEEKNLGLQFGLKLPSGSHTDSFDGGALAGQALDRGLQPGSGTTDAILGLYRFDALARNWEYFAQASAQLPLNSRDGYRPGNALNLNAGLRYLGLGALVPQLQINGRVSAKDAGANATPDDSGGKTIYLSPGATISLSDNLKAYGFVQLPVYQNLNGYQLAPRYTVSAGIRFGF